VSARRTVGVGLLAGFIVVVTLLVVVPHLGAPLGAPEGGGPPVRTGTSVAPLPVAAAPGDLDRPAAADLWFRVEGGLSARLAIRFGGTVTAAGNGPRSVRDCMSRQAGAEYAAYDATSAVVRRMDIRLANTSSVPLSGAFVLGKSRNPFVPGWFAVPGCALTLGEGSPYPNRISFDDVAPGGRQVWHGFLVYLGQRSVQQPRGRVEDSSALFHVRAVALHRPSEPTSDDVSARVSEDGSCAAAPSGDLATMTLDAGADGICR
jgi:hypothetical protein